MLSFSHTCFVSIVCGEAGGREGVDCVCCVCGEVCGEVVVVEMVSKRECKSAACRAKGHRGGWAAEVCVCVCVCV